MVPTEQQVGHLDDPIWLEQPAPLSTGRLRTRAQRIRFLLAAVVVVGVPVLAVVLRGACWESLVASAVCIAAGLALVRVGFSTLLVTVVAMTGLMAVALLGWTAVTFHTLNVFGAPPKILYCSRTYYEGNTVAKPGEPSSLVHPMGVDPAGGAILGDGGSMLGGSCTIATLMWVQTGPTTYITYELSGGP